MILTWVEVTAIISATLFALLAIIVGFFGGDKALRRELSLWCVTLAGLALAPFYNTVPATALGYIGILVAYTLANAVVMSSAALLVRLFENTSVWSPLFIVVTLLTLGLDTFDYSLSLYRNWPNQMDLILLFEYLPQVLKIGFLVLCVWALLKSWRVDLVNRRYHLRYALLFAASLVGLEMLIFENLLAVRITLPYDPQSFHSVWQGALACVLAVALLRPTQTNLQWRAPESLATFDTPPKPVSLDVTRLQQLLNEQQVYRDPRLNLNALATLMDIPVYKLRALIHHELGYQNFNVFLNDQRIQAACADLRNAEKQSTSITTIALESGFGSLAPFNRAFKLTMGLTPSQYRAAGKDKIDTQALNKG